MLIVFNLLYKLKLVQYMEDFMEEEVFCANPDCGSDGKLCPDCGNAMPRPVKIGN